MSLNRFSAILLAAGSSKRLPNQNKLLKPLNGRPLLLHVIETVKRLGLTSPVIVTGHEAENIEAAVAGSGVKTVRNETPEQGMASSLRKGLSAIPQDAEGFFIVLGDMPFIEPEDYRLLAEAFVSASGDPICVPVFEGRRGHPVLFASTYIPALESLKGDVGARSLLREYSQAVIEVPCPSARILHDFDELSDFEKND